MRSHRLKLRVAGQEENIDTTIVEDPGHVTAKTHEVVATIQDEIQPAVATNTSVDVQQSLPKKSQVKKK